MPLFAGREFTVDLEATRAAYRRVERGGVDTCECAGCRNFRLARPRVFPASFVALLESNWGIDASKDAEIYHFGGDGHPYGGWYHFIGTLGQGDDAPVTFENGPRVWLSEAFAPRLSVFENQTAVQLEIAGDNVPWLLDEPEA